ncbi:MAG: CPBP family intramembrane metalloprotease [Gammaproteobacteria bacterium]|nr:CPBP family intramembrane metalloprotease [Gammaproteobacteria bacterium]
MRAAVRAVLFVVVFGLLAFGLSGLMHGVLGAVPAWQRPLHAAFARVHASGEMPAWLTSFQEALALLCALAASAIMTTLEGRPLRAIGLQPGHRARDLASGFAVGFALLSVLVGALLLFGGARLLGPTLPPAAAVRSGLAWLVAALLIGCFEEIAFRGYLFATLREAHGFWTAAIAVTLAFSAAHGLNVGENPTGLITAALVSVLFCLAIRRTGTLWWVIGMHAAWDWAESYFYGSADSGMRSFGRLLTLQPQGGLYLSGGRDGPEGSFLCVLVLLGLIAALPLLVPERARPR